MRRSISTLLVSLLAAALLLYTGLRSLDFISLTLPPDKQVLAYFALAATELGCVLWLAYYLAGARGAWQRGISLLMIVTDFLGSTALFTADTVLRAGESGMVAALSPESIRSVILAMSAVVALNVAATLACHVLEPGALRAQAIAEGQDEIDTQTLHKIQELAPSLAAELAPQIAQEWAERTRAKYLAAMSSSSLLLPGDSTPVSKNGHQKRVYSAEAEAADFLAGESESHS